MIVRLINKITFSVFDDVTVDLEEIEVFQYGLEAVLSSIYCLGLSLFLCTILGNFYFGFFFILLLTVIKLYFTGYHATTRRNCCFTYAICVMSNLFIYTQFTFTYLIVPCVVMAVMMYLRRNEVKKMTWFIVIGYAILAFLLHQFDMQLFTILFQAVCTELVLILIKDVQELRINTNKG